MRVTAQRPEGLAALMRAAAADELVLQVDGGSMGSTIMAGSEVRVRAVSRPPRTAEVWAFCNGQGIVVVHRYRRRLPRGGGLQFRGDALPRYDLPIRETQLIGRVTHVRAAGRTRHFGEAERIRFILRRARSRVRGRVTRRG